MTAERSRLLRVLALVYAAAFGAGAVVAALLADRGPVVATGAGDLVATLVVFAASVRWDNSSVYDPYWSVAPIPIVAWALAAAAPGAPSARGGLVLALVCAWGLRLTANCLVRWRSLAHEDFRYREIRARAGRGYWAASLFSIHLFPTVLVFLGLLPTFHATARPAPPPGWLDAGAALLTGGAILIEGIADFQLRRFLSARRDPKATLERGLWALSRHPNYLGEVLFWWGLWLFGVAAGAPWWTAAGPIAISALFTFVSAPWMDRRMEAGHPGWRARRGRVPALWPWPAARP